MKRKDPILSDNEVCSNDMILALIQVDEFFLRMIQFTASKKLRITLVPNRV